MMKIPDIRRLTVFYWGKVPQLQPARAPVPQAQKEQRPGTAM